MFDQVFSIVIRIQHLAENIVSWAMGIQSIVKRASEQAIFLVPHWRLIALKRPTKAKLGSLKLSSGMGNYYFQSYHLKQLLAWGLFSYFHFGIIFKQNIHHTTWPKYIYFLLGCHKTNEIGSSKLHLGSQLITKYKRRK